jgi:sugar O-acyltransferase (sialic acid O-acetyltransferase NeuD family)
MINDLVIIGAGGFGREVAWLVEDINSKHLRWNLLGFIDEDRSKKGTYFNGYSVMGGFDDLHFDKTTYAVCAVGSPAFKKSLIDKAELAGLSFANLTHPSVLLSSNIQLGIGNIICANTILTVNISIGNHVILNLNCTVGHDVIINNYCTCAPAVNISGNVTMDEGCEIGTNASIIQSKRIGAWSIIGAGAVVTSDLPSNCTAVGVPAKAIKTNR